MSAFAAFLLGLLAGLIVAAAASLWIARRRLAEARAAGREERAPELATLAAELRALGERRDDLQQRLSSLDVELRTAREAQQAEVRDLRAALVAETDRLRGAHDAELRALRAAREDAETRAAAGVARQQELERAHGEKISLLQKAEERLAETFQNLANRILEERSGKFSEQSQQQLDGLLTPLREQLRDFREAVVATHANEQRERGMLSQQIQTLRQLNERISQDAINLTRALKGDTQKQGAWGEMVLERVLEASGLQSGREFEVQVGFVDESGGRPRPDVIVHLPEEKDLVIDAKVSLVAYERYCACEEEVPRAAALREHVVSIKRHVDGLAARNYTDLPGLKTLDFVLLFVPVEAAFIEAVRADDGLYAYALNRNISIVSPSTLLATLRTIAYLWRIERRNVNALEIARRGAALHDNFVRLVGELENVGVQLEKAQKLQSTAIRRLTDGGNGSVILQVRSLAEMGVGAKKSLPAKLLEVAGDPDAAIEGAPTGIEDDAAETGNATDESTG